MRQLNTRNIFFRSLCFLMIAGMLFCLPSIIFSQENHYNRFQYHHDKWQSYIATSGNNSVHLYFPTGYDSLGKFAAIHLPDIIENIKKETGLGTRIQPNIIIYPSLAQQYESNVGLSETMPQNFPTIVLKGGRVLVAFTGSYEAFLIQLKEAWLQLCWEEQFPQSMEVQLSGQPPICPQWFKTAAIVYLAKGWTLGDEASYHQKMALMQPGNWQEMSGIDSVMTGEAFCYFLCIKEREDAMLQLLFQFKQGKSLARACKLVFKKKLAILQQECFTFYQKRYRHITALVAVYNDAEVIRKILKKEEKLVSVYPNATQNQTAFVAEEDNKRIVYVINNDDSINKQKITEYILPPWYSQHSNDNYPLLAWSKDRKNLFVIRPEKGIIHVKEYTTTGSKITDQKMYGIDGITALIEEQNNEWLLDAYRKAQNDIIRYDNSHQKYTPLTNDKADNEWLQYDAEENEYSYRSGYPKDSFTADSLIKPYGVYVNKNGKEKLLQADTKYEQYKTTTQNYSSLYTVWMAEQEGIERTKDSILKLEQQIQANDINVTGNILKPVAGNETNHSKNTNKQTKENETPFDADLVKPYQLQLFRSWYTARVNNDYFINRLQPYQGYLGTYKFPEVGAMIASGFSDLFENYHVNIGYKMPAGTEGSDFFVRFANTKRTMDWHLLFFRKVESLQPDAVKDWTDAAGRPYPQQAKVKTAYYEAGVSYPFNYRWSVDVDAALRRGRTIFLATDKYSLDFDDLKEWWNINSITLKGHQLRPTLPLLYKGWQGKMTADVIARYGAQKKVLYGINTQIEYHQPLIKSITAVARLHGGYSGGESYVLYNLGGTNNNIVPRVDTSVRFSETAPYAFQQFVGGLRGYEQNSLYGNLYGMMQLDVYFPLFQTLIPLQTGFSSIKNLQLGIFTDIAAAKESWNPLQSDWRNKTAYGISIRTLLAGYPIRFDMAWQGSFNKLPVWYLSLSL